MKKETVIGFLLLVALACGWVFGKNTGEGGAEDGFAGVLLSAVSLLIGMISWAIYAYDMSRRAAVLHEIEMSEREDELSRKLASLVENQREEYSRGTMVFSEALARKCVIRMISTMAPEESQAHLYEQADALIQEEVEAARVGSKA